MRNTKSGIIGVKISVTLSLSVSQKDDSIICQILLTRPGSSQWAHKLNMVAEVQRPSRGWANGPVISLFRSDSRHHIQGA